MELVRINKENAKEYKNKMAESVAILGEFDGLHQGHMGLINKCINISTERNLKMAVVTFYPHPDYVLKKRNFSGYLTPFNYRNELIESYGFDYLFIIEFNNELSQMSYLDFYDIFLKDFSALVVGYDYHFGKDGTGNFNKLTEIHDQVYVVPSIDFDEQKISSQRIRELLKNGDIKRANYLLGRNYKISGIVLRGKQIGRTISFPTANLDIADDYYRVGPGVYVVIGKIDGKKYLGFANYGNNPTISACNPNTFEVHFFDFKGNIYGKNIDVMFIDKLRDEKHFNSIEELKKQLEVDMKITKKLYEGIEK